MRVGNHPPAMCFECRRFTRTVCLTCRSPLCEEHADFPICADCWLEAEREALIERAAHDLAAAHEEN